MTELLEQAIIKLKSLPASQQDAMATIILEELEDEEQWNETFSRPPDELGLLVDKVMAEYHVGQPQQLDPD